MPEGNYFLDITKSFVRKNGKDIIDFGMGNPDMPTPKHIRDKLKEAILELKKTFYIFLV